MILIACKELHWIRIMTLVKNADKGLVTVWTARGLANFGIIIMLTSLIIVTETELPILIREIARPIKLMKPIFWR